MAYTRPLLVSALCAFALPTVAFGDTPGTQSTATPPTSATNASCNYEQVCAERAQADAQARAERRRVSTRRAAARRRATPASNLTTLHVDTRIARPVADGCQYSANAHGTYRSNDPTGRSESARLRDLDVRADVSLTCGGRVVRREAQRWVFPSTTREQLVDLMQARLAVNVPGSNCKYVSNYGFDGGNLQAQSLSTNCSPSQTLAAVSGQGSASVQSQAVAGNAPRFDANVRRGGGPRTNRALTSDDAGSWAH